MAQWTDSDSPPQGPSSYEAVSSSGRKENVLTIIHIVFEQNEASASKNGRMPPPTRFIKGQKRIGASWTYVETNIRFGHGFEPQGTLIDNSESMECKFNT